MRLETRPRPGVRLDLLASIGGSRIAIEFKYLLRRLVAEVGRDRFDLPNHAAQDISRYDVVKDISQLEEIVPGVATRLLPSSLRTSRRTGSAAVATAYGTQHSGYTKVGNSLAASPGVSVRALGQCVAARARSRCGVYLANWRKSSQLEGHGARDFRYLAIEVV